MHYNYGINIKMKLIIKFKRLINSNNNKLLMMQS